MGGEEFFEQYVEYLKGGCYEELIDENFAWDDIKGDREI